jgi:hypothetical protein
MKSTSYFLAVVSACGIFGAANLNACTVVTNSGGSSDGGTGPTKDASTTSDGSTAADTGAPTTNNDGGLACSVDVGPDADDCNKCLSTKCCETLVACVIAPPGASDGGPTDCSELDSCIAGCLGADGGTTCVQACAQAHPASVAAYQALLTCGDISCKAECGGQ